MSWLLVFLSKDCGSTFSVSYVPWPEFSSTLWLSTAKRTYGELGLKLVPVDLKSHELVFCVNESL